MSETGTLPTECDIVMDGGLARALVYPSLVAGLSGYFRFRSIAGASIGAVPAVATAAAQYRKNGTGAGAPNNDGFSQLGALPSWLGEVSALKTNLITLFQPCPSLRRHFAVLMKLIDANGRIKGSKGVVFSLFQHFPIGAAFGALGCALALRAVVLNLSMGSIISAIGVFCIVILAIISSVAGACVHFAWSGWQGMRKNRLGICSGMRSKASEPAGLTEWLHEYVQGLAGLPLDRPLTFSDLDASTPSISLTLMTSSMPGFSAHCFPEDCRELAFRLSEIELLFPIEIVNWLLQHGGSLDGSGLGRQEYFRLPPPSMLPVVFATRISLSFPGLLQAIPLYRILARSDLENDHPALAVGTPTWFSYAGLTSNCPVSFFDCHLPVRPTFGIEIAKPSAISDTSRAHFKRNLDGVVDAKKSTEISNGLLSSRGLGDLILQALLPRISESKNYKYDRERVVQITPAVHSHWLNMPADVLNMLSKSGAIAANLFVERFLAVDVNRNAWILHRLVRTRRTRNDIQSSMISIENSMTIDRSFPSYRQLWREASGYENDDDADAATPFDLAALREPEKFRPETIAPDPDGKPPI
jgi:hypothetical protein